MNDISTEIQEAIDAGKPFEIPSGEHYVGKPIVVNKEFTMIHGSHPTNVGSRPTPYRALALIPAMN